MKNKRKKVERCSSGKCVFWRGQKGDVGWRGRGVFLPLLSSARCLLPNWNMSCLLPPSHLYPRHRRLAPRHQHSSACPIPLLLESQGVLQRTKRKVNLQACTASRRVAISLWGKKKKSPFFVVFLLITALCNIRKHTGTPKVLLKPASIFSRNMSWGEEKKTESWDYRQQSNK